MLQIAFSTFHHAFNRNLLAFYQIDLLLSFFPLKALLLRKKEMILKKKIIMLDLKGKKLILSLHNKMIRYGS